jgi:hypothetical protein
MIAQAAQRRHQDSLTMAYLIGVATARLAQTGRLPWADAHG